VRKHTQHTRTRVHTHARLAVSADARCVSALPSPYPSPFSPVGLDGTPTSATTHEASILSFEHLMLLSPAYVLCRVAV
jgi:hypothetical protein